VLLMSALLLLQYTDKWLTALVLMLVVQLTL
jgi:hypothetical protein